MSNLQGADYFGSTPLTAYGPDSRPPMAIFELLDYIVNEVSLLDLSTHAGMMQIDARLQCINAFRSNLTRYLTYKPLNFSLHQNCLLYLVLNSRTLLINGT